MMQFIFVGERRSKRAQAMDVTWTDGRLAAKTLHAALRACKREPLESIYYNVYDDDGAIDFTGLAAIRAWQSEGWVIVAMGDIAQKILRQAEIPYRALIHPAARGAIRKTERYQAHVAIILQGE